MPQPKLSTLVDRFQGEAGARRLVNAWLNQAIVNGDATLAERLRAASHVQGFHPNSVIVNQGDPDADLFLVLVGTVSVEVNSRAGRTRIAGDHFGELTLIDVREKRSATVRATELTVVARVSEVDFSAIANDYPKLWRGLAIEIAARLRQRLKDVPPKNDVPRIFIGSSTEGINVAETIKAALDHKRSHITIWTDRVFEASDTTIESLEEIARSSDIAVLVCTPDDKLRSRGTAYVAPRDNVVFELGLFMGALGRSRTFAVTRRQKPIVGFYGLHTWIPTLLGQTSEKPKLPTDLLGMNVLEYEDDVTGVCERLRRKIDELGPK